MPRAVLIAEEGADAPRVIPARPVMTIGRGADCSIVLDDAAASRKHVEITERGPENWHWKDLGSTNGTLLNGRRMLEGRLQQGDRLQIGESVLRFDMGEDTSAPVQADQSTLFKQTIIDATGAEARPKVAGKSEDLLRAVYSVMNELSSNYDPCDLVDKVLKSVVNAVRAERGAVFFAPDGAETDPGGEGGTAIAENARLRPCPVCQRYHAYESGDLRHGQQGDTRVSTTVVKRVLRQCESVLYRDASDDNELNMAESVMALNLRSIICVPLRAKSGVIGLLYIDSSADGRPLGEEDMLLATAVGNSAGLAIENAHMHRQVLAAQRMEQDIEHAWSIQQGFLPKDWPEGHAHYEAFGATHPARIVGGDFYDCFEANAGRVAFLIGDVSGKGVPAALTMAQLLTEFRLHARLETDCVRVVQLLNRSLSARSQRGMFCTICYGTLDLKTGECTIVNAGHHAPLVVGHENVRELGAATGPPIGILAEAHWEAEQASMAAGETLLLYTDGLAEAHPRGSTQGGDYGEDHLKAFLNEQRQLGPRELISALYDDVKAYTAPADPHDDCTMLVLKYLGG